jgi:hypothetical protein
MSLVELLWYCDLIGVVCTSSLYCAVATYSGKKHTWACGSLQYLSLYGCGVAYTITTATSMR